MDKVLWKIRHVKSSLRDFLSNDIPFKMNSDPIKILIMRSFVYNPQFFKSKIEHKFFFFSYVCRNFQDGRIKSKLRLLLKLRFKKKKKKKKKKV